MTLGNMRGLGVMSNPSVPPRNYISSGHASRRGPTLLCYRWR
jgi:hypothetical protein